MTENKVSEQSIWISVEGNISSGKSTLISFLKHQAKHGDRFGLEGYDVYFIDEDIDAWGPEIFACFYKDPARWAFTFQFKVISIRAKQIRDIREAIRLSGRPALVISERSLESSRFIFAKMCCEAGNFTSVEKATYKDCYNVMTDLAYTDLYVYCTTPPNLCKERYLKRAREGETLDLDYLKHCHKNHVEWLDHHSIQDHVIKVDTSEEVSEENLLKWREIISNALRKPKVPANMLHFEY